MLLTLHSYKEKKYLDFRPLRTYDHFIDDVLFLLQKKGGEAKVSQTSNLSPPPFAVPLLQLLITELRNRWCLIFALTKIGKLTCSNNVIDSFVRVFIIPMVMVE